MPKRKGNRQARQGGGISKRNNKFNEKEYLGAWYDDEQELETWYDDEEE